MDQSFFIGALGAHQQQRSLNATGNNIANVNTFGFKAERNRFSSLLYRDLNTAGNGIVKSGTGVRLESTDTLYVPGAVATTNRPMDFMIEGRGFFALLDQRTGEITLTRNGAFSAGALQEDSGKKDPNGNPVMNQVFYLTDGEGRFVLDQNQNKIQIKDPNQKISVGIFDCAIYNGMEHRDDTRFSPVAKNGELTEGTGKLVRGALESSNVDLAEEVTHMIEAQRAYSMALKVMKTSDENEVTINNLRD